MAQQINIELAVTAVKSVLKNLKTMLNGTVPPWLKRIVGKREPVQIDSIISAAKTIEQ